MANLIVIPARFGSTRLPGKPMIPIAGRTLLARVADVAQRAARLAGDTEVLVATDDERIAGHARALGCDAVMTDPAIASGSGRSYAAAARRAPVPDIIVNLQGDAPFVEAEVPARLIEALRGSAWSVATPVVRLGWEELDAMRRHKRVSMSSGTTCTRHRDGRALWFSKEVIPHIRDEVRLRRRDPLSPVFRHLGVYAYRFDALAAFEATPPTPYEQMEGLEQLRFLETGVNILTVETPPPRIAMSGIDTPEDIRLAMELIERFGDPFVG